MSSVSSAGARAAPLAWATMSGVSSPPLSTARSDVTVSGPEAASEPRSTGEASAEGSKTTSVSGAETLAAAAGGVEDGWTATTWDGDAVAADVGAGLASVLKLPETTPQPLRLSASSAYSQAAVYV